MFVDASALLAILFREPERADFVRQIVQSGERFTSPIAIYESVAGVMSRRNLPRRSAHEFVELLLDRLEIEILSIDAEIGRAALDAFDRYGKGRGHPAQLNMGDCFAYACARVAGLPLLYKGNDFARTDLA